MAPTQDIIIESSHSHQDDDESHDDDDDDNDDDSDQDEDLHQTLFSKKKCYNWFPCFDAGGWERISPGTTMTTPPEREHHHQQQQQDKWWSRGRDAFMKLREWSELVAGPEWKTFIRKFSKKSTKQGKFQYDPMSYALNFEDAQGHNRDFDQDEDRLFRDFSSRYAAIPGSSRPKISGGG